MPTAFEGLETALRSIENSRVDVPTLIERYFPGDNEASVSEFARWAGRLAAQTMGGTIPPEELAGTVFLTAMLVALEYRNATQDV